MPSDIYSQIRPTRSFSITLGGTVRHSQDGSISVIIGNFIIAALGFRLFILPNSYLSTWSFRSNPWSSTFCRIDPLLLPNIYGVS